MPDKSPNPGSLGEATSKEQEGHTSFFNPGDLLASWAAEDSTEAASTNKAATAPTIEPKPANIEIKPAGNGSVSASKPRNQRAMRMGISLPVEIQHPTGNREQTQTVFVLARGAVISLVNSAIVGQKLNLKNLKNGKCVDCRVLSIERGLKGIQVEIEFAEVIPDFWPVHFPSEDYAIGEQAHTQGESRVMQPPPSAVPSVPSHPDPKPIATTPAPAPKPVAPISAFERPAPPPKQVELMPLAGSLRPEENSDLPSSTIESKGRNNTPLPGSHTIRNTPVPGSLNVRNTPAPGGSLRNTPAPSSLSVRKTPAPISPSMQDLRAAEHISVRPQPSTSYSASYSAQHQRAQNSSGGGMKWILLCVALGLIGGGLFLFKAELFNQTVTAPHIETSAGESPSTTAKAVPPSGIGESTEKLTISEPAVVPHESNASSTQPNAPAGTKEEKAPEKIQETATPETKLEAKPSPAHEATKEQKHAEAEQPELAIVRQTKPIAPSRKQEPVKNDEEPPTPSLPSGDSTLTSNTAPAVLSGIATSSMPVQAPRTISHMNPPRLISSAPPAYPSIAKQNRIQGDVTIEMDVDPSGNVVSEKVLSGPPFLQAAAKDAVKRWKYQPATLNDKPIPYHMQVKVHFALQ